jgi:hypothetical protein
LQLLRGGDKRVDPFWRVQVAGKLDHGRVVQSRIAVEVPTGGEDEQRAADRRLALVVCQRDLLPCDVRGDDEVDLSRSGTPLRSSRA